MVFGEINFIEYIGYIAFIVGTLLSINAGKGLVKHKHDVELVEKYRGEGIVGLGLSFMSYLFILFALVMNIVFIILPNTISYSIKLFVSNDFIGIVFSVVYTVFIISASYYFFKKRYRNIDKPLTMEGKLALKTIEAPKEVKELISKRVLEPVLKEVGRAKESIETMKDFSKVLTKELEDKKRRIKENT